MTPEQVRHARDLLTRPDNTVSSIARLLGVSRATIYKYVPEVTTGRQAVALTSGQEQRPGRTAVRFPYRGPHGGVSRIVSNWETRGDRVAVLSAHYGATLDVM
jgi:Helix-turn-helix domain of resolvase